MPGSNVVTTDNPADDLVAGLVAALDAVALPDDAAGLEMLAATLIVPLLQPELPQEPAQALVAELERRGDAPAAGLLAAIGVVSNDPTAAQANAATARLAGHGIVSRAARRLGTLALREAVRVDGGDAELLIASLGRPGLRTVQVAVFGIELQDSGGALVECMLTPPMRSAEARELLRDDPGAGDPREVIDAAQLTHRIRVAAQRTLDIGGALSCDAATALPLVARALTGDPGGFARPEILPPWDEDDGELIVDAAEDEDRFHELMEMLLDEYERSATSSYEPGSAIWRHGDFVASCMLQWKGGYDDGALGRWTIEDLEEFLLGYFPRKVTVERETLDVVPDCVLAFLRFLDDRESLSGAPIEQLEEACADLRGAFREQAEDPATWGLAKSMAMQMLAEGIDPAQPGAMEAWTQEFNARPIEQRDATLGGAADRMLAAASPLSQAKPTAPAKRRQRKAQRSARKRNRR